MDESFRTSEPLLAPLSKEDFAYERLRTAILSAELAPGTALQQVELARRLGISAIPVRGALKRLAIEGLVTQESHRTPTVATLELKELEEVLLIRTHLEILAIRQAVPCMTPVHLKRIRQLLQDLAFALKHDDMLRFGSLNRQFHFAIFEACPQRLLVQMISDFWDKTDRYRSRQRFVLVPQLAKESLRDHRRIADYVEKGAAAKAAHLLAQHNDRSQERFLAYLRSERNGEARGR